MKTIAVRFLPGDRVVIGDVHGHVSCVSTTWTGTRFEVTWWDCGQRRDAWFDEFELEADDTSERAPA